MPVCQGIETSGDLAGATQQCQDLLEECRGREEELRGGDGDEGVGRRW